MRSHPARRVLTGLLFLATWALAHSYQGLFHDAGLYTLQALAHLRPDTVGHDVFLRYGSQDRYTLFGPLFAALSRCCGVEFAAASLTLTSQLALLLAAAALARSVLSPPLALLGSFVVLAMPGDYGADRIFTCFESFLTPRMAGEALTLAALAAALTQRRLAATLLLAMATAIHPIMAAAGLVGLAYRHIARPHPRVALALAVVGSLAMLGMARFDGEWLALLVRRSPYLFLHDWQLDDWSRVAVSATILAIAARTLPDSRARQLSSLALFTVMSGLLLTAIACDALHLVLFTQLQPWRWQWLATVVAALLMPATLLELWNRDTAARASALLLMAAFIFAANSFALAACGMALASSMFTHRLKPGEARWIFWGACGLLAIATLWRLASDSQVTDSHYLDPTISPWIRGAMSCTRDGIAPMALMAMLWLWPRHRGRLLAGSSLGALLAAGCIALTPQTWKNWTAREFTPADESRFAAFRQLTHDGGEIFWPESPVGVWMLLDRPSYLSVIQTSGMVFSRASAVELNRRADALSRAVAPAAFMSWNAAGTGLKLSADQLRLACGSGEFEYLVTDADLGMAPLAVTAAKSPQNARAMRLYRCRA